MGGRITHQEACFDIVTEGIYRI